MRSLLFLTLVILILPANAQSNKNCEAILKQGVFDRQSTMTMRQKHEVTKNVYCSSSSGTSSFDLGGAIGDITGDVGISDSSTSEICSNDYSLLKDKSAFVKIIEKASDAIVSAWEGCIQSNFGGVSHYIEPKRGFPDAFNYKIIFTASGKPYTSEVLGFQITNATCVGNMPVVGTIIDGAGIPLSCERASRDKPTTVVAQVTTGGGRLFKNISLPKYSEEDDGGIVESEPTILCKSAHECRDIVGETTHLMSGAAKHELNGIFGIPSRKTIKTGDPVTNATQACYVSGGKKYYDHEATNMRIGCGKNYGLIWWDTNKKRFNHHEVPICLTKKATVISRIWCKD